MNFLRAALREVVGLFVGDWLQSIVIVVILAAGWFAFPKLGTPAVLLLVLLLAAQMVWFARAEARRSRKLV
jgi:hypothetical protein